VERGSMPMMFCSNRGGRGILELIHVGGALASMILCRHGGEISTSGVEALHRFHRGCSKPLCYEAIRFLWLGGGPRLRIFVGRGLPSSRPLLLGGDAWRTLTRSGGDAHGLNCFESLCSRVFLVKSKSTLRTEVDSMLQMYISMHLTKLQLVTCVRAPTLEKISHLWKLNVF
jgi:hypothetical protein